MPPLIGSQLLDHAPDAAPSHPTLRLVAVAVVLAITVALGHPALALLAGIATNLVVRPLMPAVVRSAGKLLLQGAIVLLGLTLSAQTLWSVSQQYAGIVVLYVLGALGLGLLFGRWIGADQDQSRLLASGTAICGGTTIATLAPVIRARPESVAVCLAIVFLLNALAILALPPLGQWLGMSQVQFGSWVALAIHDTSSVVGAAAIYGEEALQVATTVKLARTLWLIPLVLIAGVLMNQREARARVPAFVVLFVLASVLGTFVDFGAFVGTIKSASQLALIAALFLIGTEITRETLRSLNARAVWLGVGLWMVALPTTYFMVMGLH
ncbi:MAG: YeiH family protein [Pseudomonadales bacterium]